MTAQPAIGERSRARDSTGEAARRRGAPPARGSRRRQKASRVLDVPAYLRACAIWRYGFLLYCLRLVVDRRERSGAEVTLTGVTDDLNSVTLNHLEHKTALAVAKERFPQLAEIARQRDVKTAIEEMLREFRAVRPGRGRTRLCPKWWPLREELVPVPSDFKVEGRRNAASERVRRSISNAIPMTVAAWRDTELRRARATIAGLNKIQVQGLEKSLARGDLKSIAQVLTDLTYEQDCERYCPEINARPWRGEHRVDPAV